MAKKTLGHVLSAYQLLTYTELETSLLQVAAILNQRPITARMYDEDEFDPVVPRDLLLGRPSCYTNDLAVHWDGEILEATGLIQSLDKVREFVALWWQKWLAMAIPMLAPRRKWRVEVRALKVGDVVVLVCRSALGPGSYRLGRIGEVHPDVHGVVRTLTVEVRNRRRARGEGLAVCKAGVEKIQVPVQRVAVILPVEETWGSGGSLG